MNCRLLSPLPRNLWQPVNTPRVELDVFARKKLFCTLFAYMARVTSAKTIKRSTSSSSSSVENTFLGNFAKFLWKNLFSAFFGFLSTCEGDFPKLHLWFMHQKTIHLQNTRQPRQSQSISWNHSKVFSIPFKAGEILFPDPTRDS